MDRNSQVINRLELLLLPVNGASTAVFRVLFGALMLVQIVKLWQGDLATDFLASSFQFHYFGFEWVKPLPSGGMSVLLFAMGVAAIGIMVGFCYRVCCGLFCISFAYLFLLEQSAYQNHFYLIILLSGLLAVIPAHRLWSIDCVIGNTTPSDSLPRWALWILRFQLAVPYVFGGIAKLHGDWLRGYPMRQMLLSRADLPVVGQFLQSGPAALAFAYGGLVLDLLIVPLLLCPATRRIAFVAAIMFHVTNGFLLNIGIFPWLMIAATTLFLEPGWPRSFLRNGKYTSPPVHQSRTRPIMITTALSAYVLLQMLIPLRQNLYPGDTNWTEYGHRFSWRMKLRAKTGIMKVEAFTPRGDHLLTITHSELHRYLSPSQVLEMPTRPDMIQQFCRHIGGQLETQDCPNVEVRATVFVSLNGRPMQLLVDPNYDLAHVGRSLLPQPWILPLKSPGSSPVVRYSAHATASP